MENKLQELTQKLYDEGLSKGRQEADALLADARAQAKKIISDANAEAERIIKNANTSSEDLRKNTLTELSLAGKQVISQLKSQIQDLVIAKSANEGVAKTTIDPAFLKEMLVAAAQNWQGSSSDSIRLSALLPESMRSQLDASFEKSVKQALNDGIDISFTEDLKSGFRIGPKDGGYYISFTDESFDALLAEYLRPKVSEILYGKNE